MRRYDREAAGDEIIQVEFFESATDRVALVPCARARTQRKGNRARAPGCAGSRKLRSSGPSGRTPIERERTKCPGCAGSSRKTARRSTSSVCEMRSSTEAQQRFEANFVRKRAAEFDQRAPVIEPVAIEKVIETRLHPIAQRLKQKRSHDNGDHSARRARLARPCERVRRSPRSPRSRWRRRRPWQTYKPGRA